MLDDPLLGSRLRELIQQWNIAERRIKRAEQVRENEIVSTAIYELRYAGRKVMDAIYLAQTEDWRNNSEIYERIRSYLDDATEDCIKAKHDAIDSMVDFVTTWLYDQERKIGLAKMQYYYPRYLEVTASIATIQDLIEESRGDRTKRRDSLYDQIETSGYNEVIEFYQQMRRSVQSVQLAIDRERRRELVVKVVVVIEIVVGIALIALHSHALLQ
jgi:flagellar motility protein MotE (MotC chaperone)